MSSNIPVNEDCVKCFNDMKLKKNYSYVIMSVKDNKEVVIEEIGEPFPNDCTQRENEEVFNRLREKLLDEEKEPKYLLFDFRLETGDGRREKIAFINWCSDRSTVGKKTVQASTEDTLKKLLRGVSAHVQANDADDLEYYQIAGEVGRLK